MCRVSQQLISRVERGLGWAVKPRTLERIAERLGARLVIRLDWKGEGLDRLLDADHADLVAQLVARLEATGWTVIPEATFVVGVERGSVDVLAWHAESATALLIEVKSVVPDIQAMLMAVDRKERLAAAIAAIHGWRPRLVASVLVIGEDRTARRRVEAHRPIFDARFPERIAAIRRLLASPGAFPEGPRAFRGLWFLPFTHRTSGRHRASRVRSPGRA